MTDEYSTVGIMDIKVDTNDAWYCQGILLKIDKRAYGRAMA
jgi:hypothetical protein